MQRFSIHDGPGIRTLVFFKGCPLSCAWCQNPEAISSKPQFSYVASKCIKCRACSDACQEHAIIKTPKHFKMERCLAHQGCTACEDVCPTGAIEIAGKEYTVPDLLDTVLRDKDYYDNSGGGITCSGGEPTAQWSFVKEFLLKCKEVGISTAIETCGYFNSKIIPEILNACDVVLFDVKHADSARHKDLTGVSNVGILTNLKALHELFREDPEKKIIIRTPLIPGINDQKEHLLSIESLLVDIGVESIVFLPYHALYEQKIDHFFLSRKKLNITPHSPEELERIRRYFSKITVSFGG
ncbi:MAG: glycyl-radical enzyme activating protein [Promethearchaeota archaeon]